MPGLTFSNELISRDEGMHTDFAVLLYSKLNKKAKKAKVHELFKEAVEIEKCLNFSCKMIDTPVRTTKWSSTISISLFILYFFNL